MCHGKFQCYRVKLFRWEQAAEMGITVDCCNCVVTQAFVDCIILPCGKTILPQIFLYSVGNLTWGLFWEGRFAVSADGARERGDAYEITAHP